MPFKLFVALAVCLAAMLPAQTRKPEASRPVWRDTLQAAIAARESGKIEESVSLFARVLEARPAEGEALWYQGLNYYDLSRYPECESIFARLVRVDENNGPAWAFLGLCEFRNAKYEPALAHIVHGKKLDVGTGSELDRIAYWHYVLLLNKLGHFEAATSPLVELATLRPDTPMLVQMCGLNALRLLLLPHEVPESLKEPVLLAGNAALLAFQKKTNEAKAAADKLIERYPKQANAYYLLGYILSLDRDERSIEAWQRTVELDPKHVQARLQIANQYMQLGRAAEGMPYARKAVELAPGDFMTHTIYGRLLLEQEKLPEAIAEFETAAKAAPRVPLVHFHLARAYALSGQHEKAAREKEIYAKLESEREVRLTPPELSEKQKP